MVGGPAWLVVISLVVHAVFLLSVFDIYFTSPIEHGAIPQFYSMTPPAKRLVLFVADGLRADTVFSLDREGSTNAPYLREVIRHKGRWGVSHTHVPTESRPGHVALIAGFYEDVSAVMRGWKENPVEFDSVFNSSIHTWSWGSPDILPMFSKGAVPGRVDTVMYDAEMEDFADEDPSRLDTWVFERVEEFFATAKSNKTLARQLDESGIIFFLHLIGLDTNGHSHKPQSQEVLDNLRLVDEGVERISAMIDLFFDDDKTALVFTSDHGMTDWGSHGAGLEDETMTPLICWGAGIKNPVSSRHSTQYHNHDGYTMKWDLGMYERLDVQQADIAPLMASLLGTHIPVNSEGVLPLDYIHYNKQFLAESIFANARQLLEQVRLKEERISSNSLPKMFRPFSKLTRGDQNQMSTDIDSMIRRRELQEAISLAHKVISLSKEAMRYYHTYHRFSLKLAISLAFVGWVINLVITLIRELNIVKEQERIVVSARRLPFSPVALGLCATLSVLQLYQAAPLMYCVYYSLPVLCWDAVIRNKNYLVTAIQQMSQNLAQLFSFAVSFILLASSAEMMVLSFFYREVLSVMLVLLSLWPYITPLVQTKWRLCCAWTLVCWLLAIFPLMPSLGRDSNIIFVTLAGVVVIAIAYYLLSKLHWRHVLTTPPGKPGGSFLLYVQLVLIGMSLFVINSTAWHFNNKESIPLSSHVFCWVMLALSLVLPFLGPLSILGRLLHIALVYCNLFFLLSTTFEAIFIVLLCCLLYIWLDVEQSLVGSKKTCSIWEGVVSYDTPHIFSLVLCKDNQHYSYKFSAEDVRRIAFCIFFGLLSFFGIGNIASINTFDVRSVYCFLTVFSPFVMASLLIFKMVIPFIFVSCSYNIIICLLCQPLVPSLLLSLILSDVMGINFFFLVQDSGSWLDIGITISHFVIVISMVVAAIVLLSVARLLTGRSVVQRKAQHTF